MGQQEGRWEMVRDRARDFEAERQPKGETASERGARQLRKDNGETRSDLKKAPQEAGHAASRVLLFIWQILA